MMMQETRRNSLHVAMLLTQLVLILQFKSTECAAISKPGCQNSCGEVEIPYPFGIGSSCSISADFNLTCNTTETNTKPTLYLYYDLYDTFFEILNINLSLGQARMNIPPVSKCYNTTTKTDDGSTIWYYLSGTPYWLNNEQNEFVVFGCNTLGYLTYNFTGFLPEQSRSYSVGCLSTCFDRENLNKYGESCSGVGCCKTAIPSFGTESFYLEFDERYNNSEVYNISRCSYAMVIEDVFVFNTSYITTEELINQSMPVLANWVIQNTTCQHAQTNKTSYACKSSHSECLNVSTSSGVGYLCNCSKGFEGNPYLEQGCQDINECNATATQRGPCSKPAKCHNTPGNYSCSCPFGWRKVDHNTCQLNLALVIGSIVGSFVGIVALSVLGFAIYMIKERRNLSKIKEKYFQQNGGWILLENIKSTQGFGFTIFTKQQIEQATNNFDSTNIIGYGGQGTVYKGTISDQTVAIKKSKIASESKKKEFGKEMLILSQISHKNIVKLIGCCLEVEVPILVYEFISNGTLFQYIHNKRSRSPISLSIRLRIAHESAEALAYLHTSASPPIFHGDVKSSNILLDQNYTAKISDFGASILAPTNEEQFVTLVQGTCGYLDPEYMQSCQLKDKSDVYSFGVVLVELLTGKPVIDFDLSEEERSLSSRFISVMKENKLDELLDNEIINENDMKLIREVAELAIECLSMKGEERPTMKKVAEELYRIIKLEQHPWGQEYNTEETTSLLSVESRHDIEIEHSSYHFNIDKEAQESIAIGR